MRIALNGLELPKTADGNQTVGEVLNELRNEVQNGRKIITEICLDGQALKDSVSREAQLARPVNTVQRMDLRIEEAATLRALALMQTEQLTVHLQEKCKPISRKFRMGDEMSANRELATCLDELQLIALGLDQSLRMMDNRPAAANLRNQVTQAAERLVPTLDNIYHAQSAGDFITVADEIEYDLAGHLANWRDLLQNLKGSLTTPEQVG